MEENIDNDFKDLFGIVIETNTSRGRIREIHGRHYSFDGEDVRDHIVLGSKVMFDVSTDQQGARTAVNVRAHDWAKSPWA